MKEPARILRRPDVEQRTGLKRAAIYAKMREGNFPKPIKLGERAVGWIEHEVEEWIAARIAARNANRAGSSAVKSD